MDYILLYKINGHFIDVESLKYEEKVIVSKQFSSEINQYDILDTNDIFRLTSIKVNIGSYVFINHKTYIYFVKITRYQQLKLKLGFKDFLEYFDSIFANKIVTFRHVMKESLIDELTSQESTLEDRVKELSNYTFSSHYSLWIYHKDLDCFTCSVSSFDGSGLIINGKTECTLKNSLNESRIDMESRPIKDTTRFMDKLSDLNVKYLNRICIEYGDRGIAIASFYSNFDDFKFDKKLAMRLSQSLKSKLTDELETSHEKFEEFTQMVKIDLIKYKFPEFAQHFLQCLCEHFKYELATLYFYNDDHLVRLTSFGENENSSNIDDLEKTVSEALREEFTSYVFSPKEMLIKNLDGEEITNNNIKSVVVNPFELKSSKLCLISVNKLGIDKKPVHIPSSVDLDILERVIEILIFSTDVYYTYENLRDELEKSDNFSKVWRHEIRTPINKFTLSPDIIKMLLRDLDIEINLRRKIEYQLDDIKMFGSRLKQLTDTYNFKEILKSKTIEKLSIMKDVVYPISSLTKEYAKKQYNLSVDDDHDSFRNFTIMSDKKLLNMVLNALVDNALKYSTDNSKFILISGQLLNEDTYVIKVSNKGSPIHEKDLKLIFQEGERGDNAKLQKIDGTGIGLFIAHTVMNSLGGDIIITSNDKDKIEFSIMIPFEEN